MYAFFRDVEDNFNVILNFSESQKIFGIKKLLFGAAKFVFLEIVTY